MNAIRTPSLMSLFPDAAKAVREHGVGAEYLASAITTKEELADVVANLRQEKNPIVWTSGAFDLLHPGHILFLQDASRLGALVVGVNSDASIQNYKPFKNGIARPLLAQELRVTSVMSLKGVRAVLVFDEPSPIDYLRIIKPDVWVRGGSYQKDYGLRMEDHPEGKVVTSHGGRCVELPMIGEFSTTDLAEKLRLK